jgi:hypothetical protein
MGRPHNPLHLTPPGDTIPPAFVQHVQPAGTSEVSSDAYTSPAFIQRLMAAVAVFALLSASVPAGAFASAHLCAMACCVGHAPHPAGSYSGGSCRARLSTRKAMLNSPGEKLCGARLLVNRATHPSLRQAPARTSTPSLAADAATLTTPCDCGCAAFGASGRNSSREKSAGSHADRPRPPTAGRPFRTTSGSTATPAALYRRFRPRAPPFSS